MDQTVITNQQVKTEANFLARDFELELQSHEPADYDQLLQAISKLDADCHQNQWFVSVSKYLGEHHYRTKTPEVQRTIGCTALLAIHQQQLRVGDVEEFCDIPGGHLAKLKSGQVTSQTKLMPWQIVLLASTLGLTMEQLVTNFTNQPTELQAILQPAGANEIAPDPTEEEKPMTTESQATTRDTLPESTPVPSDTTAQTQTGPEPAPRPPDPQLAAHIRAALEQSSLTLTDVMAQTGIGKRLHLTLMERGNATLTDEQVRAIAKLLDMSVQTLYSGEGLRLAQPRTKALTVVKGEVLPLPPRSVERQQEFYRGLCLRRGVTVAEGQDVGELLEAARAETEVNWYQLWLRVTKQGADFWKSIEQVHQKARSMGDVARADFLKELHQLLFPPSEEGE